MQTRMRREPAAGIPARRARTASAAVAVAVVVLMLGGCAASAPEPAGSDAAPTESIATLGGSLEILAAASLTDAFTELASRFGERHPDLDLVVDYGASSTLAQRIVSGAPADVFAAASPATMTTVTDAALTAAAPRDFASNILAIAVAAGNPGEIDALADFADPSATIAVCAIEVPCGAAAQTVFDAAGLTASVDTYEQDVKAVLTKVQLGEVDAGLVYATDVLAAGDSVEGIDVAEAADAVNGYSIAPLGESGNPDAAAAFVAFVLSAEGRSVLVDLGFGAP